MNFFPTLQRIKRRASVSARWGVAVALGVIAPGCGHVTKAPSASAPADHDVTARRLLLLESDTTAFFGRPLSRARGDRRAPSTVATTIAAIETETASLESIRMRYLDVIAQAHHDRDRVLAMLKIAELHLDLGARIRRAPYPADATAQERAKFDQLLSRKALPLEAVAHGMLAQILDLAERRQIRGRYVDRAALYVQLHAPSLQTHRGGGLGDGWAKVLEREWSASGPFAAPKRLLEAGRIGQRAARR